MTTAKLRFLATSLAAAAMTALPALAQPTPAAAASISAGMTVVDGQGGEVGTVAAVKGDSVIVKTDKHEAALPKSGFATADGKLRLNMTRDQLNAAVEKGLAEAQAKLAAGATVTGPQGNLVGTIDAIDDQFATLKLASGKMVRIPRTGLAAGANGAVIGVTLQQLEAQAAGGSKPAG